MKRVILTVGVLAAGLWTTGCASPNGATTKAAAAGDCCVDCEAGTAGIQPLAAATGPAAVAMKGPAPKAGEPGPAAKGEAPAAPAAETPKPAAPAPAAPADAAKQWTVLFDGKSLDGWQTTMFGGNDDPTLADGEMVIPAGATLGGVNYTKPTPVTNYEVEVVGRRRSGTDFWCGLTVPVGEKQFVSLILGGWGGSLCGISSIDGMDASENNTMSHQKFEKEKWYTARLRVQPNHLSAWLDDKQIVDEDTTDRRLSIRIEVSKSKPFGIATWQTEAGIKSVRIRQLTAAETAATTAKGE